MDDQKKYTTSLYGRFGYFVMCFPYALFALMFLPVLKDMVTGIHDNDIVSEVFFIAIGIGSLFIFFYNLYQITKFSPRFITTSNVLIHKGILGTKMFDWKDVTKISLNYAGKSPYVLLNIFTKKRKLRCKLDVSGLEPNYKEFINDIRVRMKNVGNDSVMDHPL
ncbi:hypothetical protein [uncultured Desulfobulbus sp.]|uniref:hypothetical protein n=1 Tax=uncultured Desulfobulbus sp. TaxID=239745 RepID=UPI0029C8A273|nr:hypothetical protein [uncultured Desulfobulbus sp.]